MKILAIRLKNLASLAGPFELDFTAEPLASAGLFAITGPTGAGKSTLLDALCLALFGAVPRLNNTGRDAKVPDADGEIATGDPRTLLRRGTGEGYAEVDFVGIDGRRYRARWEANRAREKATGKLQASRQSLRDLDSDQLLASQKGDYKVQLEARLGLNFEQFTRAVMLAQSEFSAFLKADDNERSELLEKLTDTALYTRLGKRAFDKAKEAKDAHKLLLDQAVGVTPLEPEARAELDQRFEQAQQQLKNQQGQLKQLEQQHSWLKTLSELQEQRQSAADQLQQAQALWDSQADQRQTLHLLEQLAPQRHQFARLAELEGQLSPLAEQISAQLHQQTELGQRKARLEADVQNALQAASLAQEQQREAAPRVQQAHLEQANLDRLTRTLSSQQTLQQQAEQACNAGQQALDALLERQQQGTERLAQIATQLERSSELAPLANAWDAYRPRLQKLVLLSNSLTKGREELPGLELRAQEAAQQLSELRNSLEILFQEAAAEPHAVNEQIHTLGSLLKDNRQQQRAFEELQRLSNSQHALDVRLQELQIRQHSVQQERDRLSQQGIKAKADLEMAEQTLQVTRQLLERQRLARSASVEELRGQLQDDQPCPVCGSAEHPYHQPEALLQSLGRHDEAEETSACAVVDGLKETLAQLREKVGGLIAQQKEFLQQQERIHQEQQALAPDLEAHPLYEQWLAQEPGKREQWLSLRLEQLHHSITQDEQRQNVLLALQKEAAHLQQQVQRCTQASQLAAQQLAEQHLHLNADSRRLEEELSEFASLLTPATLDALRENPSACFMTLDRQVADRLAQLDQQRDEQAEQAERASSIEREQYLQANRRKALDDLQASVHELGVQQQASQHSLKALLGDHASAGQWQQTLEQAVEQARAAQTQAEQALQATANQLLQLTAELKAGQERQQALQQEHAQLGTLLGQWRAQHSELDDSRLQQLLAYDDSQVRELRQQLQHSEKAIEQTRVLLQEREQRLALHQAQANGNLDAEALNNALVELHAQLAASEQQCAELRARQSEDQRRQQANQALAQRIAQAYDEWQRWARLSELIGSGSGDKFRKIAQAYNLDLLVHHANAQLRQLVRRYRLKRGGSMLGLLVMDTEMGDELRSVHSLSGGETFLVSLALALGLASMASSTLKIESLFIDEGFGSLDPESLQLAMDALDGLQAQGRKVGVISHVQEMHERIPVQIQVRRQGNGLSTVEVK
ncbi:AAA family ATPase [Pseudomonas fragi]|uniref:Nuclease SbcCD subunit C n=1 Tax=Pseudomonas fragi TaxID=296 RepID=A0A267ADQ1_PSEFR|nr:AAA family ATPase [Pseudomonas fragi]PAA10753.1 chromosome segregation protein SMC [Pseudomonas fragi]